jgi:hypothetical protein
MTRWKLRLGLVACVLAAVAILTTPAVAASGSNTGDLGCLGCNRLAQTDASNGTDTNPLGFMSASATRESATTVRVTVRDAGLAQSADVRAPSNVGPESKGELRGLSIKSNGGVSSFTLQASLADSAENLSVGSAGGVEPPETLDRPRLYLNATADAPSDAFQVTYQFDVGLDDLRDDEVSDDAVRVFAFYGGEWQPVRNVTRSRDGGEVVVDATTSGTVPLAFGYRRPQLSVTALSQDGPLLTGRDGTIRATVENRGHRDGRETFEIETRNDTILGNHSIFARAGQRRTVQVPVRFPRSGEWPVEIDDAETTVRVEDPQPDLVVTNLSLDRERIAPGETVTLTADVRNDGSADGSDVVAVQAFDTVVGAERLRLSRNATHRVTFTQRFDAAGTYTVRVGNLSRTVVVGDGGQQANAAADRRATTESGRTGGSDGSGTVRWIVVVLGAGAAVLFGLGALGRIVRDP